MAHRVWGEEELQGIEGSWVVVGSHTQWIVIECMLIPLVLGGEILNICQYHIVNYVFGSLCVGPFEIARHGEQPGGSGTYARWVRIECMLISLVLNWYLLLKY